MNELTVRPDLGTIVDPDADAPNILWTLPDDWTFTSTSGRGPHNPWAEGPAVALATCGDHLDAMRQAGWPIRQHGRTHESCVWCDMGKDPRDSTVIDDDR